MNRTVVQEVNAQLLSLAATGLILGLETGRVGMDGGIEGAFQAIEDVRNRNIVPSSQITLLWPFDRSQGKFYQMKVILIPTSCRS